MRIPLYKCACLYSTKRIGSLIRKSAFAIECWSFLHTLACIHSMHARYVPVAILRGSKETSISNTYFKHGDTFIHV